MESDGGSSAAKSNYRPMPERWLRLARKRVLPMLDQASMPLDAIRTALDLEAGAVV